MSKSELFMKEALKEAHKALDAQEVPVGAVIVFRDEIISRDYNRTLLLNDPSAHAEILALRSAGAVTGNHRLTGCDLYVTLEPCVMCLGAAVLARIARLYFGAYDPKSGAAGTCFALPFDKLNHKIEIKGGILERECGNILKDFFIKKR